MSINHFDIFEQKCILFTLFIFNKNEIARESGNAFILVYTGWFTLRQYFSISSPEFHSLLMFLVNVKVSSSARGFKSISSISMKT